MTPALLVFFGMVACLMAGYYLGYHLGFQFGKATVMTRSQAASILAKASWKVRDRVQVPLPRHTGSFVRFTR